MPNGDHEEHPPLPDVICPVCGAVLHPQPGPIVPAFRWTDCLRRCEPCQIGFSNAQLNPTIIHGPPQDRNVPLDVRAGAQEALNCALNLRNQENKLTKFGYCPSSEDALTWTVFKFLHDSNQLTRSLRLIGLPLPGSDDPPRATLLWGVPIPFDLQANPDGWVLRSKLISISNWLCEDPLYRTEPDVVIDLGDSGIIIIEVKHRSRTDTKAPGHSGWSNYYPEGSPFPASQCYELARNWRFGLELALSLRRPFSLVYLGPHGLFRDDAALLAGFEACLANDAMTRYRSLCWDAFLGAIADRPNWFVQYIRSRGYPVRRVIRLGTSMLRTIAIGDIHGCSTALRALIEEIQPSPDDLIIVLGDFIDCGPDSNGVIDQLISLASRCRLVTLLGNHEEMLINALESKSEFRYWLKLGGKQTLDSYCTYRTDIEVIPAEHVRFIRGCVNYFETDAHIFVHANYNPDIPVNLFSALTLRWNAIKPAELRPHFSGKTVVVGHTPQVTGEILDLGFLIGIDTDCFRGGWLTGLDVATGEFIQAAQEGQVVRPRLVR